MPLKQKVKASPTVQFSVRLPPKLYNMLVNRAKRLGLPISAITILALREHLERTAVVSR